MKRKAPTPGNYYNNPNTTGSHPSGANSSSRRPTNPPRSPFPAPEAGRHANNTGSSSQTLFTSILAPPVAKQTRTILNANDPPVAAPVRPAPSPRLGEPRGARTIAPGGSKGRGSKADAKRGSGKAPGGKRGDKRRRLSGPEVDADGDVDMRAAATLTSLLYNHRPSVSNSAGSPRSSMDGSENGSQHSFSHYAQSSTRTIPSATASTSSIVNAGATSLGPRASVSSAGSSSQKARTPPPTISQSPLSQPQQMTPKPAQPNDSEAADLMLYLATSPSPARPSNKETKDQAAYRVLSGGNSSLRTKGRVLFPGPGTDIPGTVDARGLVSRAQAGRDPSLNAYGSTHSPRRGLTEIVSEGVSRAPSMPIAAMRSSSNLLPPPPLPGPTSTPNSPAGRDNGSPRPSSAQGDFNFSEYINASPGSPVRGVPATKANLGLRADVGRKLFEEEQMRMNMNSGKGHSQGERPLGAGIDLLKS